MGTAPTLRAQNKHDLIKKSKSRSQSKMGFSGNTLVEENDVDYHSDKVKGHGQGEIGCHGDKVEGPIGEIEEEAEEWDDELEEVHCCCINSMGCVLLHWN